MVMVKLYGGIDLESRPPMPVATVSGANEIILANVDTLEEKALHIVAV